MQLTRRLGLLLLLTSPLALCTGCARPGPPKPPSLQLPAAVTDLSASRAGDTVDLHLTAPRRASDGVPLPPRALRGILCRQVGNESCVTVGSLSASAGSPALTAQDVLPPGLASGPPRLLRYRVEFFNGRGHSIGPSEPAYTVAGDAPLPVEGLSVTGARNGILVSWKPAVTPDEVLLERVDLAPHEAKAVPAASPRPHSLSAPRRASRHATASPERAAANTLWLQANAETGNSTLDATADPGTPYRYRALRRRYVQLGGRRLELRSAPSLPVEITLREIYPPAAPSGLSLAAYLDHSAFAVDLIWQPVDDDTRTAALVGYNIYRETLDAQGDVISARLRLNPAPVLLPAFHDATALPGARYRYNVTAIDARSNESPAATRLLEPQP